VEPVTVALPYMVWSLSQWSYPFVNVAEMDPTCHRYKRVAPFTMASQSIGSLHSQRRYPVNGPAHYCTARWLLRVGLFSPTSEAEGGVYQHISPGLRGLLSSSQIRCMHVCACSLPWGPGCRLQYCPTDRWGHGPRLTLRRAFLFYF
jgi:hypothetical protein